MRRHQLMAAEALRLRAWAEGVLFPPPRAEPPGAAPPCSRAAWRLFLGLEACALPLRSALGGGAAARLLAPDAAALLEEVALREQQRALSALAQLRRIGALAGAAGWKVAALKGGAAVAGGCLLDLHDLDVLAAPAQAEALAAALDEAGYQAVETASGPLPAASLPVDGTHHPPRFLPNSVPVEVHQRIRDLQSTEDLIARAVPLPTVPGAWQLAPADHLWHVLVHGTLQHPAWSLRLRDVLVQRAAARACDEAALEEVRARCARSGSPYALDETLRLALGSAPFGSPALRRRVARRYLLYAREAGPLVERTHRTRVARLIGAADLRWVARQDLGTLGIPPPTTRLRRLVRACYRLWPALGALLHRGTRLGVYAVYAGPAALLALEERWLALRLRRRS